MFDEILGSETAGAAGYGSGLIGGILDAFIGPVMANEQFQRSKHVSNRQMAGAQFLAENQPAWAVQGLINAGLNPVLGATKGVAPAQFAPSPKTSIPSTGSFARALEGGISSAKQLKLLNTQAEILDENLRRARNEADASGFLENKVNEEIREIGARIKSLEQGIQTNATQADLNRSSAEANRAGARLTDTRNRAEKMAIPYSEEQLEATKPMVDLLSKPRNLLIRILEGVKREAEGVREYKEPGTEEAGGGY